MPETKFRVVVDTNLWISYLLTTEHFGLDFLFAKSNITFLFSQELLSEFVTVAQRPKFRKYFSLDDLAALLLQIQSRAELVETRSIVSACRDAKDNFLLELVQDGNATHLITGDKDLLVLQQFNQARIVTMATFLTQEMQ